MALEGRSVVPGDSRTEDERFADLVLRDGERRLAFKTIMQSEIPLTGYKIAKLTCLTRPFVKDRVAEWIDAGYVLERDRNLHMRAVAAGEKVSRHVKPSDFGLSLFKKHSCFFP